MKNLVFFKDDLRCNICNLKLINEMCITHKEINGKIKHYFELRKFKLYRDESIDELSQIVDYYEIQSDLLDEATEPYLLAGILTLLRNKSTEHIDFSKKEVIDALIEKAKRANAKSGVLKDWFSDN